MLGCSNVFFITGTCHSLITFLVPDTAHNIQTSHYWKFRISPELVFYHAILCAMITSFAVWFCYLKFEAIYILIFCSVFINICFYDYSHITPLFLPFDFISLRFYYRVIAESAASILRKRCLGTQFLIRFQLYFVLLNSSMDSSVCIFFLSKQLFCQSFDQVYCNLIPLLSLHFFLVKGISL